LKPSGRANKGGEVFHGSQGGIYCLPNGRELIVLGKRQNGRVSYRLSCGSRQYEVSDGGRLICDGKLTAWDISNLYDTGQSVGHEKAQKVQYDY